MKALLPWKLSTLRQFESWAGCFSQTSFRFKRIPISVGWFEKMGVAGACEGFGEGRNIGHC